MLTFSKTEVQHFFKQAHDKALRLGQAFHQYFQLEKVTSCEDKLYCDRLYEKDGSDAVTMIMTRVDCTQ